MAIKFINSILFFIIFLFKYTKNEQLLNEKESLRFLIDKNISSKLALDYESDSYSLFDNIREYSKFHLTRLLQAKPTPEPEPKEDLNPSYNVRCTWIDFKTLTVYDLSKLKSKV